MKNLSSKLLVSLLCFCAPCLATPGWAQEAQEAAASNESIKDVAARFGVRSSVLDISLSPSGTKIAWVAPGPEHTEVLNVFDMNGAEGVKTIITNSEQSGDLTQCEWVTDSRLICSLYGMAERSDGLLLPFTRMFAINDDGSDVKQVSQRRSQRALSFNQDGGDIIALDVAGKEGEVLLSHNYVKEASIGTRLSSDKEGLGVDRYNIESGRRRTQEKADPLAAYYIADENGDVRIKVRNIVDGNGRLTNERVFMYRPLGQKGWEKLTGVEANRGAGRLSPIAVNASTNSLYGFQKVDGFQALVEIALDGSATRKTLVGRPNVDVNGLIRIGRKRRVVGAVFATEKRSVKYFDPQLAKLSKALSKALPNQPLISIAGASADEKRLIIVASSDTDPGTVYLFDKDKGSLEQLLAMREYLVNRPMGKMAPVTFPAADGVQVPGYLTLPAGSDGKNLPTIILPHGGPAARDYWGFDWLVQFFTARGYAVLQPNYRGSSGYGEAWFGRNGYQAWNIAIGDVNDAGRWMVSEGIANPDKMAIVGWSYGGYAALQSQVVDPQLYKAVVAIAPVTDLEFLRDDARNYTNFKLRDQQLGRGPHIAAGSPRRHAEKFTAPVALFHGSKDVNVDIRHSKAMANALKDAGKRVTYTEFDGLEHSLRDSKVRAEMLESIDSFLNDAMGR